jgi:hypothetical protein
MVDGPGLMRSPGHLAQSGRTITTIFLAEIKGFPPVPAFSRGSFRGQSCEQVAPPVEKDRTTAGYPWND